MKKIILFRGAVETLEYFSEIMSYEFEKQGFEIVWVNLLMHEESGPALKKMFDENTQDEFTLATFNFEGLAGELGLYSEDGNWNVWDYSDIKVINILVDHPLYYHKYILNHPKNYLQIDIDPVHVDYMHRFFPTVNVAECVLSGGTELLEEYLRMGERPIDVIFTGNFTPKTILKKNLKNMDEEYVEFYESILSELIENPALTIDEIAETRLKQEFPDITDEQLRDCMPNMMYVDLAVRFHFRELAIRALVDSGIKIHTFGDGYNHIQCKHPENIIAHGGVDSLKCLKMISQSKMSLNVMPWFKKGAHDRVFNSMLNGSVSITDHSEFLDKEFKDEENVIFYDLKMLSEYEKIGYDEEVVRPFTDRVKALLKDEAKLQKIADNAYAKCINTHTWGDRAKKIIKML